MKPLPGLVRPAPGAAASIFVLLACPTAHSQTPLYTFDGDSADDRFGVSVSAAGDVNGDGFDDLIVGAYRDDNNGSSSGSARVFSGVDGSVLYTFDGDSAGDEFGISVSGAGDVNGDGFDDLIVGADRDDNNGTNSGSARVFSGVVTLGVNYCGPAIPNSTGFRGIIRATGSPLVVLNDVTLTADQLPPGQFGYFLASQTYGFFNPPGSSGFICLGGAIGRYNQPQNIGQGPTFSIQIDLTAVPQPTGPVAVQPDDTWNFQCWYRDLVNTNNFTDAVSILLQ